MLQRSPSYVLAVPGRDPIADLLRRRLGPARAHRLVRRKNILMQRATYGFCRRHPRRARRVLRALTARQLPPHVDVDTHFRPAYDPWDQRLCIAPDGDLFAALRAGTAAIVTDRIETITPAGVRLASGGELAADVLVTATGLTLLAFGGTALAVDGEPVVLSDTVAFRGMMLGGLPNFAFAVGYTNSSWTLKVDLVAEHFCRLLTHMDAQGHDVAVPRGSDPGMATRPLLDFAAGYIRRSLDELPRQGDRPPWQVATSYYEDVRDLRRGAVTDPELRFSRRAAASGEVGRVDQVVA
jgi:cation diffusion facilitator CzcD-associated flavoprotein CzcO